MKKSLRAHVIDFAKKKFKVSGDSPWVKYPEFVVLRHNDNKKWFGLLMNLPYEKLGLQEKGCVDVLNLKTDSVIIGGFMNQPGILPAYHMNKSAWASILLDGSVDSKDVEFLLTVSFELTRNKKRIKHENRDC